MVEEINLAEDRKKKLRKILKTSPEKRCDDDIKLIEALVEVNITQSSKTIQDNKFLKQFKGTVKLKELCKYMRIQHFGARETIIQEGDIGETFYIIYSGRVSVYKQQKSEFSDSVIMTHLTELGSGEQFGELALLQKAPRSATVIASIPTDLIVLDKTTYENVIQNLHFYQIDGTIEFFQHLPLFQHLNRNELFSIASKCQYKRFPTNTIILRQDDIPKSVYFIKAGRIKVLKKVDFKIPEEKWQFQNIDYLIQDPSEEDYELELVESKLLEIDDLGNGDVFAEDAIILKQPIKHSIITAIPSEIFMLDMHDFLRLHKLRLFMLKLLTKNSNIFRLTQFRNFERQLRKPQQMPVKFKQKAINKQDQEDAFTEQDVLNTNYLSSVDYIFKAQKQKRNMLEVQHQQQQQQQLQNNNNNN
ncbi:cyclic nucleotide-binding domain containing protein [Stylonychia lemnae]|uniref:Cyclic nucleotide-binding domain containing protein n=1 Tax=Stylonychia lemnae TaxID=5949 RepID=A0A077ZRJ7_STYLE|nr:cyclic nucleotide-binding domain containing protein [Stylonychia lemnae]|eukprot:CDW71126.1 cyclic nucleotide-binding domain containing protein [Stylonychia lemnae]